MSTILDYFSGEEYKSSQFQIVRDNSGPEYVTHERLRHLHNTETIRFSPNCQANGNAKKFTLWEISKAPENFVVPGLILECGVTQKIHLLIPPPPSGHGTHSEATLDKLRQQLEEMGCKPLETDHISTKAKPINQNEIGDGAIKLWWQHPSFKSWSQLSKLATGVKDTTAVINPDKRFLCKGGSFLIVAPSGIGKSTLLMQMAISWAVGRDFFGLKPAKDIRCLVIQRENDDGDVAEMVQGIKQGLNLDATQERLLESNLVVRSVFVMPKNLTFSKFLKDIIALHKADIVFVDPLFAFLQGDFNAQEFVSETLRQGIDPVLRDTGCILISAHHTPKPPRDPRASAMDNAYAGFGTSELTNWHRAIATLRAEKGRPKTYRFIVAKRGNRTNFPNSQDYVLMQHSKTGLFWEPAEEMVKAVKSLPPSTGTIPASSAGKPALQQNSHPFGKIQKLTDALKTDKQLTWPVTSGTLKNYIVELLDIELRAAGNRLKELKELGVIVKEGRKFVLAKDLSNPPSHSPDQPSVEPK